MGLKIGELDAKSLQKRSETYLFRRGFELEEYIIPNVTHIMPVLYYSVLDRV